MIMHRWHACMEHNYRPAPQGLFGRCGHGRTDFFKVRRLVPSLSLHGILWLLKLAAWSYTITNIKRMHNSHVPHLNPTYPVCLPWRAQTWYMTCGVSLAANAALIFIRSLLILCYKPYIPHSSCMASAKHGAVSGQLQMQLQHQIIVDIVL